MARLTRKTSKVFGETASSTGDPTLGPYIGQFGSAKKGYYTGTGDIDTIQSLDSGTRWANGWIDAVTPTQQFPTLPEMTGVHKVLSYQENYILQEGIAEWETNTEYYKGALAKVINGSDSTIYVSIADNNAGNNPTSTTGYWKTYYSPNYITNCILEAPNGVCSASGATITFYSGLKVLMPNGRNADGTLKNIEYTVPSNFTFTQPVSVRPGVLFIDQNGNVLGCHQAGFGVGLDADKPTTTWTTQGGNHIYYATDTNKTYWFDGQVGETTITWVETPSALITKIDCIYSGGTLQSLDLEPYYTTRILKANDQSEITNWAFPSNKYREYTLGATNSEYIAPADGWFYYNKATTAAGQAIALHNLLNGMMIRAVSQSGVG